VFVSELSTPALIVTLVCLGLFPVFAIAAAIVYSKILKGEDLSKGFLNPKSLIEDFKKIYLKDKK